MVLRSPGWCLDQGTGTWLCHREASGTCGLSVLWIEPKILSGIHDSSGPIISYLSARPILFQATLNPVHVPERPRLPRALTQAAFSPEMLYTHFSPTKSLFRFPDASPGCPWTGVGTPPLWSLRGLVPRLPALRGPWGPRWTLFLSMF